MNRSCIYYIAGYRYWCMSCLLVEIVVRSYHVYKVLWGPRVGKLSSLCTKSILNRDQLVKYLGFPLPELEIIYTICAKGCRKIRDAEFLEDIIMVCWVQSMDLHNLQIALHKVLNHALKNSPWFTCANCGLRSTKSTNYGFIQAWICVATSSFM